MQLIRRKTREIGNNFLEDCKLRGLSHKTLVNYTLHIRRLVEASLKFPPKPEVVQHLLTTVNGGAHNADTHYRTFHALGNYAKRKYKTANFMDDVVRPRVPREIMPTISDNELNLLAIETASPRDKAILALFIDTAIRKGEAVNLQRKDIKDDRIIIQGKTGYRAAPISEFVRDLILSLPTTADGFVFHGKGRRPLGSTGFYKIVKGYLLKVNYQGKQFGPQTLRRSFGRFWLRDGGDMKSLSIILGHSNIATTANYYTPLVEDDVVELHQRHTPGKTFAREATNGCLDISH